MSCRTTKGGTVAHRIARAYSGLSDNSVQKLFHALKREGENFPDPTPEEIEAFRIRMRKLIEESGMSEAQIARSEQDLFHVLAENPTGATFYSWNNIEALARQESVIRSVKGMVVDLEEPGSQAEFYEIGEDGRPLKVWYASYGSNLAKDRFETYIAGGAPEGTYTAHPGARDTTLPEEDVAIRYHGRMHFAAASNRWGGGGVAFMDDDAPGHSLGRAYKIGMQQFDDVVAQENGRKPGDMTVETKEALAVGKSKIGYGLYGTLVHIGDFENAPVFTFTSDFTAKEALTSLYEAKGKVMPTNSPTDNYMRMIGSGLSETFGMSEYEQADYIRGSLGASTITREHIIKVLTTPMDEVKPPKATYRPYKEYKYSGSKYSTRNDRWDEEWDSYKSADYWGTGSSDYWGKSSDGLPYPDNWFDDDDDFNDYKDYKDMGGNPNTEKNWWDFDSTEEYEEYLASPAADLKPYTQRKVCLFCGELGHKMNDCDQLKG